MRFGRRLTLARNRRQAPAHQTRRGEARRGVFETYHVACRAESLAEVEETAKPAALTEDWRLARATGSRREPAALRQGAGPRRSESLDSAASLTRRRDGSRCSKCLESKRDVWRPNRQRNNSSTQETKTKKEEEKALGIPAGGVKALAPPHVEPRLKLRSASGPARRD